MGKAKWQARWLQIVNAAHLQSIPELSDDPAQVPAESKPKHPYFCRGSAFSSGSSRQLVWNCPHCPFQFEADTFQEICLARYRHNQSAHGGQFQVGRLTCPAKVAPQPIGVALAWKCRFCEYGISEHDRKDISADVYRGLRRAHRRQKHPHIPVSDWRKAHMMPTTATFRLKRRAHLLNVAAAKRKIAPTVSTEAFEFFMWPMQVRVKKVPRVSIRNAWRCRSCQRCFTEQRDTRAHQCVSRTSSKCTKDRIDALNFLKDHPNLPEGLNRDQFDHLLVIAIRALQGQVIND